MVSVTPLSVSHSLPPLPLSLLNIIAGKASVSTPVALFDDLSVQKSPVLQVHIGQDALVFVSVVNMGVALVIAQPDLLLVKQ